MGKKKSKVSKQKQAKAKHRQTSLGGVVVSKGFKSKFQQSRCHQQPTQSVILHTNVSNNNKNANNRKPCGDVGGNPPTKSFSSKLNEKELNRKLSQKKHQPKVFFSPTSLKVSAASRVALQPRLGSIEEDTEQRDFDHQFASLQERQWVVDHKTNTTRKRNKKSALKGGRSSNIDTKTGMFGNMQPASFRVEKETQDLLQETMHKMIHMTGVGISAVETTPIRSNKTVQPHDGSFHLPNPPGSLLSNPPSTGVQQQSSLSSLATVVKQQQEERKRFVQEHSSENPFAALGNGDSEDEEDCHDNDKKPNSDWSLKIQAPSLQFTPASFSLVPRQTPTPASTPIPSYRRQASTFPQEHGRPSSVHSCSFSAAAGNVASLETDFDPDL